MSLESKVLEEFDRRFDNYHYVAELYAEAQVGDLNLKSLRDFISNALAQQRREMVERINEKIAASNLKSKDYCNGLRDARAEIDQ